MKKNDTNIRNLYRRFSNEMDQLPLPSVEELITDNEKTLPHSQKNGQLMPLNGNPSKHRWLFATAAAILAAILCISILMRSNRLSVEGNNTLVAANNSNEHFQPETININRSEQTENTTPPSTKGNRAIEQQYANSEPGIIVADSIPADTTKSQATDGPSPFLATKPKTTETDHLQITYESPSANSSLAAKATTTNTDSTEVDTSDSLKPQKRNNLMDESQRAMKEKNNRREKTLDNKSVLEEKTKGDNNDLHKSSRNGTVIIYRSH